MTTCMIMRGSRKLHKGSCQRGFPLETPVYNLKRATNDQTGNAILMALHWWTDDGPTLNAGWETMRFS